MTIQFMVIAAPRSATTWTSNWLTTDTTLCLHDPLWTHHYSELDSYPTNKMLGIACTGIALFPEWVNAHPARKIILRRDLKEIDVSMERIGLTEVSSTWEGVLDRIDGVHLPWTAVFDQPQRIYEYLLDKPFDAQRHAALKEIRMQPHFPGLIVDQGIASRLVRELSGARAH